MGKKRKNASQQKDETRGPGEARVSGTGYEAVVLYSDGRSGIATWADSKEDALHREKVSKIHSWKERRQSRKEGEALAEGRERSSKGFGRVHANGLSQHGGGKR